MLSTSRQSRIEDKSHRMYAVIQHASWVGIIAHASFIPLFYALGAVPLALFNVFSVIAWVLARQFNQRGRHGLAVVLITTEVALHAAFAVTWLSWASGFHYYIVPLIPFLIFNQRLKTSVSVVASSALLLLYLVLRAVSTGQAVVQVDPTLLRALEIGNMLVPFLTLALISYVFRVASTESEAAMERLAMTDALTRLPNRRAMMQLLQEQRKTTEDRSFTVLMVDLDHFKRINDTYGHDCGDLVLSEVAKRLRNRLRDGDVVARWGGEEFVVLLPNTTADGAKAVCEALRESVTQKPIEIAQHALNVSVTAGVASTNNRGTIDEVLRRADEALYRGKTEGRNRVVLADDESRPLTAQA